MNAKTIGSISIPLFFIAPFLGFVVSLFRLRSRTSAVLYVLSAMLVGFSISFSDTSADSYRYAEAFYNFDNTLNFDRIVTMYQDGELRDLYRLLLFYFVSLFSTNPKILYAVAGLVYGVFSYLSIMTLIKTNKKWDKYLYILGLIFFTLVSIVNVNGFRFNTGAVIFYYSVYQFILRKKNIWALGILITPFFHYGFILIVPVVFFY